MFNFDSPSMMSVTSKVLFFACTLSVAPSSIAKDNQPLDNDNQQFNACLDNLATSSAFSGVKQTFNQYRPASADTSVVESLNYQPEFAKEPWDYLASLVDKERVADGIAAQQRHADILAEIESQYGISRYDVLGVWGVESDFGTKLGKKDVVSSLATLSCFGRRQSYFRSELVSALKILKNGDIDKSDFKGSWAGAFGQTQFMPSTFLSLAQDFDGDGRKDLVNSQADALASTANFLKNSGYKANQPWGYEVRLPISAKASSSNLTSNYKNKKPMAHWRHLGITLTDGNPLPDDLSTAGLFLPSGSEGPAFLVGRNFDAFYAYNASENYALAIAHLSQLIEHQNNDVNFVTPWPTDDPGLSRKQSREVQTYLNMLGYDVGDVDGIIGDDTRRAIQSYQADMGLEPDGRAGQKIHQHLMDSTYEIRRQQQAAAEAKLASEREAAADMAKQSSESVRKNPSEKSKLASYTLIIIGFILAIFGIVWYRKRQQ